MRSKTRPATALLALAAALGAPAAASAAESEYEAAFGSTPASLDCPTPLVEQPFSAFGDPRDYVLSPGGSFSDPNAGWSLRGGARIDDDELSLREDGSATSPAMCVDLDYPHARFRYRVPARKADDAQLRVEVRYPDADADDDGWERVAKIEGDEGQDIGSGWSLSPDVEMRPELGGSQPGWRHVQIRLRSKDERWRIDDVYVDPKRRS